MAAARRAVARAAAARTTSVAPNLTPVPGDKPVTLTATVSPVPTGGTVAFELDGSAVSSCGAQPVNTTTGQATSATTAPRAGGAHTVKATYSGTTGFTGSDEQEPFTVSTAKVTISGQYDFGTLVLSTETTRTQTVGNAGDAVLDINRHAVYVSPLGPSAPPASTDLKVVDDQCSTASLAPGQTCAVTVRLKPTQVGERTAEMYVSTNSETHFPQTSLTGLATVELPPTPTPEPRVTPTPPAPPAPPAVTPTPEAKELKVSVSIPGRRASSARTAIPVDPAKPLTVGCDTTAELDSCAVELTTRIGGKDVTIGRAVAKNRRTDARIRLNAKGRKLLASTPEGLAVKVAVTGRGAEGAQTASTTTRLVANRTVTLLDGFATNSAELPAKRRAFVDGLARKLKRDTFKRIVVTGHTDSSDPAGDAYRKALGLARAPRHRALRGRWPAGAIHGQVGRRQGPRGRREVHRRRGTQPPRHAGAAPLGRSSGADRSSPDLSGCAPSMQVRIQDSGAAVVLPRSPA